MHVYMSNVYKRKKYHTFKLATKVSFWYIESAPCHCLTLKRGTFTCFKSVSKLIFLKLLRFLFFVKFLRLSCFGIVRLYCCFIHNILGGTTLTYYLLEQKMYKKKAKTWASYRKENLEFSSSWIKIPKPEGVLITWRNCVHCDFQPVKKQ